MKIQLGSKASGMSFEGSFTLSPKKKSYVLLPFKPKRIFI
jgi:hypothetical protein